MDQTGPRGLKTTKKEAEKALLRMRSGLTQRLNLEGSNVKTFCTTVAEDILLYCFHPSAFFHSLNIAKGETDPGYFHSGC